MAEPDPRKVFVVHGRNEELRTGMFQFLRAIGLAPIEWNEAIALTGHASPFIGEVLDAAFKGARAVVVLMTPDEVAYLQAQYANHEGDPETRPAPQARPNVLFEAGMAIGRDAARTVLVEVGQVRSFSDIAGRHTIRLGNDTASRQSLAQRLETAGCAVDLTGTDWHTIGNFNPPSPPGGGSQLGRRIPSNSTTAKSIDFDLRYMKQGGNQLDRLEVINRGTETALGIQIQLPENAGFSFLSSQDAEIPKIPGKGKSVTISVLGQHWGNGGGDKLASFDVIIKAHTEAGDSLSQEVWVDTNR